MISIWWTYLFYSNVHVVAGKTFVRCEVHVNGKVICLKSKMTLYYSKILLSETWTRTCCLLRLHVNAFKIKLYYYIWYVQVDLVPTKAKWLKYWKNIMNLQFTSQQEICWKKILHNKLQMVPWLLMWVYVPGIINAENVLNCCRHILFLCALLHLNFSD